MPIFLSQNNGDSFLEVETDSLEVNSFATVNDIVVGPESGGNTFWRSANSGEGWTEITNTGASDTFSSFPQCVRFYSALNEFVFLGENGFIWHSEDASAALTEVDLSTIFAWDFSAQAVYRDILFLGTQSGDLLTANFEGAVTLLDDNRWFSLSQSGGGVASMIVFDNRLYVFFQNGNVAYSDNATSFYPCTTPNLIGSNETVNTGAIPFIFDEKLYSWYELSDATTDTLAFLRTL